MRDRLIELLRQAEFAYLDFSKLHPHEKSLTDFTADYLLENGVMVPPCKIGDVVFVKPRTWGGMTPLNYDNHFIRSEYFLVAEVVSIIKNRKQNLIKLKVNNRTTLTSEYKRYPISSIGKTVFATRKEVEQALQGGSKQ